MSSPDNSNDDIEKQLLDLEEMARNAAANDNISYLAPNTKINSSSDTICYSVLFLLGFGVPKRMLVSSTQIAIQNGTTAAAELIAHGGIKEKKYFQLLAKYLRIRFVEAAEIEELSLLRRDPSGVLLATNFVWARTSFSSRCAIVAPSPRLIGRIESLNSGSNSANAIAISCPSILRSVISKALEPELTDSAVQFLASSDPKSSARVGAGAWQGALFLASFVLIVLFASLRPSAASLGVHLFTSLFFVACVLLRLTAAASYRKPEIAPLEPLSDYTKPTYSVMVTLLDEADVVPDLIQAMLNLRWPRSKLEIKLVCEANDQSTLAALEAEELDARFEIIRVPESQPRTKPKALCYSLRFTTGKYIAIYDAEDRPHPEQLLEAYQALENGDEKLACVQAPLIAANPTKSFWTTLFHFEYAALFGGLLPWLARNKHPIMLGGTSNHFDRGALLDIGMWDPHNVTEDADLGLRIWRKGYHTDMITRPTWEDAPPDFRTWLPQRTRWFKGWLQTWIVQMKRPLELRVSMSWPAFIVTQILLTGTIVSALVHPLVLAKAIFLTVWIAINASDDIWTTRLAILDWLTISLGYFGFAVLCWKTTSKSTHRRLGAKLLLTPLYWLAQSVAAWRGLFQLFFNPFLWEKTPHAPHEK